jgi:PAS domain S-box-containing protein
VREIDALSGAMSKASTILRGRAKQQEQMEEALRKSEEHFRTLADSMPQLVWTAGPNGRIEYTNARRERYGSGGLSRTDWETIIHPDDRRATAEAWLNASESGAPYEKEHRLMVTGRGYVWHLSRAAPLLDEKGAVVRWYGATTDIDEHKLREQNIRSLMAEVNHRSRNLLAVAIAIARRSVIKGDAARDFEQKFSQRLIGLFASQDVLTSHDWRGVPVDALVRAQSADRLERAQARFTASGPAISLNPSAAQTLGLALHELVSNAIKYGALSGEKGTVDVSWRIDDSGEEPRFEMEWRERGGPPIARKPARGFGSIVIERMAAFGLNGSADLDFASEGVCWKLSVPLEEVIVTF